MAKIPSPKFNLKYPNVKSETLIFLVFRYRGQRVLYSTSMTIRPEDWDFKTQRPIEKERRPDLWSIRQKLNDIAAYCKSIYIDSHYGVISTKEFKETLDLKTGKIDKLSKDNSPTLLEFLDTELEEMQATKMNKGSFQMFKLHVNIIKHFIKEKGKVEFEDVDWALRLKLIDWLSDRNVQVAYGNKTLNVLRQFMERARRKKLHNNTSYQGAGWSVSKLKAKGPKLILNTNELETLADLPVGGNLEKVRDLFLIGAGTGQRFGDYSRYTPDHFYQTINGVAILSIISQKTAIPAKVPLNIFPWLIPTLEKYDYTSPTLSMQKFNDGIKVVCQKAGIDQKMLVIEQYIGRRAKLKRNYVPKHEIISSHACRRSFATNLYRMGYSLAQIMPMTGHSTESQLREYIGIDAEQNAEAIALDIQRNRK